MVGASLDEFGIAIDSNTKGEYLNPPGRAKHGRYPVFTKVNTKSAYHLGTSATTATTNVNVNMTLEDFENSLVEEREKSKEDRKGNDHKRKRDREVREGERRHRHHHHRNNDEYHPKRKRHRSRDGDQPQGSRVEVDLVASDSAKSDHPQRDSWMEAPSAIDINYVQRANKQPQESTTIASSKKDFELKIHQNELNKHHLEDLADRENPPESLVENSGRREPNYVFGDAGSRWRMTKLKGAYRRAKEEGRRVEEVAMEQFGDLQSFDEAREEEIELDRRSMYGPEYVGKEKPSGELFKERMLNEGARQTHARSQETTSLPESETVSPNRQTSPIKTLVIDQTALNRLKAQLMKAKLRGGPDAKKLEAEYNKASAELANTKPTDVIVLGAMENRMLTGGRKDEVKAVDNKRGRERGLVQENEDMSIEDMVREERRTRGKAGGDGLRLAERIAKDGKFDNDLEYMDENAAKLAKRVHKSEVNLKNTAISDFQKMNRILDTCPLCHHEDTNKLPAAPIVSLATRVYLTLPTEPEISDGGACIIPIQHRTNLLECDDDEWEEIRNFMKSLTRMYHDQGRSVIFYENAATPQRHRHAGMEIVPLPYSLGGIASQFFKEAILASDEEWTQHKKIIDTLSRAKNGLGKLAFRRTLAKEMPYFHVWFEMDGGLGHVVEDANRWPKGDLFAREILGGMLDKGPEVIKKQGTWRTDDARVEGFRKRWRKFDWTRVLTE